MSRLCVVALLACDGPMLADGGMDSGADAGALASCAPAFGAEVCSGAAGGSWYCYPAGEWNGRAVVHLVGTGSDPLEDHRVPERACSLGFAALAPRYENEVHSRIACAGDGACYERFHEEIVYGTASDVPRVDVPPESSIRARLFELLAGADRAGPWVEIERALSAEDWSAVTITGHSQGSGHALYLARDFAAERLVMLSGLTDRTTSGVVGWVDTIAPRTDPARMYGYIHDDDTIAVPAEVGESWDHVGLGAECTFDATGAYDPTCRRIRIPADMCDGTLAHAVPVVVEWGARCFVGFGRHSNEATWAFLLSSP